MKKLLISISGYYSGIRASFLAQPVAFKPKKEEINMMKRMSLFSSVFRSRKNLSKEVEEKEERKEEGPYTSYSHQEGDKILSRKKTPFSDGGKGDKLTMLLPKSTHSIHGDLKEIRRETDEESPRGFDPKENSRFVHSGCEHSATHYEG